MKTKVLQLMGLTIDCTDVKSLFADDGTSPRWSGKVVLKFVDAASRKTTTITANWVGQVYHEFGSLCDFEGEPEHDDPIYETCRRFEPEWSGAISEMIGVPTRWEAHCHDIAERKQKNLPPFDRK